MKRFLAILLVFIALLPVSAHAQLQTQSTVNPMIPVNGQPVTAPPVQQNFLQTYNNLNTLFSWFPIQLGNQLYVTGNLNIVNFAGGIGASSSTCWRGNGTWGNCAGSASGSSGWVQYNAGGNFASDSGFSRDPSTLTTNISFGGLTLGSPTSGDLGNGWLNASSGIAINGVSIGTSITLVGDVTGIGSTASVPTSVVKWQGVSVGTATATAGNLMIGQGSSWLTKAMSGDATLASSGALTLANTAVTPGSYNCLNGTVDSKGRLTSATAGSCSGGGGSGSVVSSTIGQVPVYVGTTSVQGGANFTASAGAIGLGVSGTLGSVAMGNATSGVLTIEPVTGALGTTTTFIPVNQTLVGRTSTDTLTNKTISGSSNTLSNIGNASLTNSSMTIAGHSVSLGGTQAIAVGDLSIIGANTLVANFSGSTGVPSAQTAPACANDGAHAWTYTNGTGIVCSSITGGGGGGTSLGTSAANTSPSVSGDTTTGLYTSGAKKVDVAINGTKMVEIGTSYLGIPSGTTGARPASPANGMLRYNSTTNKVEGYINAAWNEFAGYGSFAVNVKAWPFNLACDGTTNDTTGFVAAMAVGLSVFIPPTTGGCALNQAQVPGNTILVGTTSPQYDTTSGAWSHLVPASGATYVLDYSGTEWNVIQNLDILCSPSFSGTNALTAINVGAGTAQDEFLMSSVRYCGNGGFGDTGSYPNTVISIDTNWFGNGLNNNSGGIVNPIDSEIDGGSFTENFVGISMGPGANNNVVSPMTRIEFNHFGVYCFQCAKEDLGGTYDRNGDAAIGFEQAGFSTGNSGGGSGDDGYGIDWGIKVHGVFTRNGSTATAGNQAHFEFYGGNTNINFSDITTSHDCGDNGCATDGPNSPKYIAEFQDSTDVNINFGSGGYTGYTTSVMNVQDASPGPANLTVIGAVGFPTSQYQGEQNFTGDMAIAQLATPGTGTVTNGGATGAATWTYEVVALSGATAHTGHGATFSIANGPATLTTTNYLNIALPHVQGATSLAIYRTAHGTTPSTNGLIATVPAQTINFQDSGLAGDASTAPTTNTTGNVTIAGNLTVTGTCTGCGGGGGSITLTTTGTSGAATLVGTTLNIPIYSSGGGGGTLGSLTANSPNISGDAGSGFNTTAAQQIGIAIGSSNYVTVGTNTTTGIPQAAINGAINYTQNTDPVNMPHFRKCMTNVNTGNTAGPNGGRCRILGMGASVDYGYGSQGAGSDVKTYAWLNQLSRYLGAYYGVPSDFNSFMGDSDNSAYNTSSGADPRWTSLTGLTNSTSNLTLGGQFFMLNANTVTANYKPDKPWDTAIIWYGKYSGGPSINFAVDGGSATTVNTNATAAISTQTKTATAPGIHTLNMTCQSANCSTAQGFVSGYEFYDSTHPGISVIGAGAYGDTTTQMISTNPNSATYNSVAVMQQMAPDVVIFGGDMLGNDATGGVSVATTRSNLVTYFTAVLAQSDLVCVSSQHADTPYADPTLKPYDQAMISACRQVGGVVADEWSATNSYTFVSTTGGTNWSFDTAHLNQMGYNDWAANVAYALLQAVHPLNGMRAASENWSKATDTNTLIHKGGANGNAPVIVANGASDTNVDISVLPQAAGGVAIGSTAAQAQKLYVNGAANAVQGTVAVATATYTPAINSGNDFTVTLSSSCPCTLANPSGTIVPGQGGVIYVVQDGTGSRTITTWGSQYLIAGGTSAITLSTAASAIDTFSYKVKDATHIILAGPTLNATH